jgi:hypothetical protein
MKTSSFLLALVSLLSCTLDGRGGSRIEDRSEEWSSGISLEDEDQPHPDSPRPNIFRGTEDAVWWMTGACT